MLLADDLNQLLNILPNFIRNALEKHSQREQLVEIVLDMGRRPEARRRLRDGRQHDPDLFPLQGHPWAPGSGSS